MNMNMKFYERRTRGPRRRRAAKWSASRQPAASAALNGCNALVDVARPLPWVGHDSRGARASKKNPRLRKLRGVRCFPLYNSVRSLTKVPNLATARKNAASHAAAHHNAVVRDLAHRRRPPCPIHRSSTSRSCPTPAFARSGRQHSPCKHESESEPEP